MKRIAINGLFYNNVITGIERSAHELTKRLDSLLEKEETELILPSVIRGTLFNYKNMKLVNLPKTLGKKQFNNIKYSIYLMTHNLYTIDYVNNCPFFKSGIVFLHDIYYRQFPQDFKSLKEKIEVLRNLARYKKITTRAQIICTVSEYSKQQIIKYYHVPSDRIHVIYWGVEYMDSFKTDDSIMSKYPQLKSHDFYFTLGSLSVRKNLKWIMNHAELYPDELFVISGTSLLNVVPAELVKIQTLKNIILAGYLSDEQVKYLMQHCKAFIFPSYFEGFGLPPLEALRCGAKIIVSNASCLPEIYGSCAHYIDPSNPDVNLDTLLSEHVDSPSVLFKKYSLDNAASQLYSLIKQLEDK